MTTVTERSAAMLQDLTSFLDGLQQLLSARLDARRVQAEKTRQPAPTQKIAEYLLDYDHELRCLGSRVGRTKDVSRGMRFKPSTVK